MEQGGFCIGPGSVMGTNGFKWTGRDPMDDCSILWLETWGLTSLPVQYWRQSKVFAKRRLARKRTQENISSNGVTFYDSELGDGGRKSQKEELVVHPERPELLPEMDTKTTTSLTMERGYLMSVKVNKWTHLVDAMMRGVRILLAYLLMLVVMTYDLTLITVIVVGFVTGFFAFSKDTAKVPVSADPCCS
ncbi:unnamed protein product [Peronospora destructor]|uniref:Copper transport protein n=1 Tax=Peronospora destructor TaxID=86335 RepID=A0AAV0T740_9STRA|nr:unnamed protein product [Peronospora destructor]